MENFVTVVAKFYCPRGLALTATSAFGLGKRRWRSPQHRLRTVSLELQQVNQVNKQVIYTAPKTKINHGA